jgi:hypothetical protein
VIITITFDLDSITICQNLPWVRRGMGVMHE